MTAHGTRDTALEAVRRGAYDYFTKPFRLDEMEIVMRRALEKGRLVAELDRLREQVASSSRRGRIVGRPRDGDVRGSSIVGPTDALVSFSARAVRQGSCTSCTKVPTADQHLKLTCAAFTSLSSRRFWAEKGAFTGRGRKLASSSS